MSLVSKREVLVRSQTIMNKINQMTIQITYPSYMNNFGYDWMRMHDQDFVLHTVGNFARNLQHT